MVCLEVQGSENNSMEFNGKRKKCKAYNDQFFFKSFIYKVFFLNVKVCLQNDGLGALGNIKNLNNAKIINNRRIEDFKYKKKL